MKVGIPLLGLALVVSLAGCSRAQPSPPAATTTTTTTTTTTITAPAPVPTSTGAIAAGPVTSSTGVCPYLGEPAAADALGIRLGRQTVLTASGAPVGCQFYATTDPTFVASERLPGPNQPVLQINTSRYTSTIDAHNAMATIGTAGGQAHSATIAGGIVGVAYQTGFDPSDANQDWAFVFSTGMTVVTVITAQTDTELDAQVVAGDIAPKL